MLTHMRCALVQQRILVITITFMVLVHFYLSRSDTSVFYVFRVRAISRDTERYFWFRSAYFVFMINEVEMRMNVSAHAHEAHTILCVYVYIWCTLLDDFAIFWIPDIDEKFTVVKIYGIVGDDELEWRNFL